MEPVLASGERSTLDLAIVLKRGVFTAVSLLIRVGVSIEKRASAQIGSNMLFLEAENKILKEVLTGRLGER